MKIKMYQFRAMLIIALSYLLISTSLFAQTPEKMNYQAVIRNSSNALVCNQAVRMQISILQGSASGTAVYTETQTKTTNANGLVSIEIGTGTVKTGNFSTINWASGSYFIKTETDPTGGTSYTITGTSQLLSVPYALHAKTAETVNINGNNIGDMQYWNGTKWVILPAGISGQVLSFNSSNLPEWQSAVAPGLYPPLAEVFPASNIETFAAQLNGTVNANGLSSTIVFEWGKTTSYGATTSAIPDIITGNANTTASVKITGLQCVTKYHYRIKATNAVNVTYSKDTSFTTNMSTAQLTTNTITNILIFSVTSGGNITYDGGSPITSHGVCWDTTSGPTLTKNHTNDGTGIGSFTSALAGLAPNTIYFVRAYATNSVGTSYGNEVIVKTKTGTISDKDGNTYYSITIGTQVWMAENLKTTKYNDSTAIPLVTNDTAWDNLTTPAYCWYNNDSATYAQTYGALYDWYAVNTDKLCPTGWHVPSDTEWTTLITYLGGESAAADKLKEKGTTHWNSPSYGTNETDFTALPGGCRADGVLFSIVGTTGYWWSATETNATNAWFRGMYYNHSFVDRSNYYKKCGHSVRCVKD